MAIAYPAQSFGTFKFGMGFNFRLIHNKFGFDLGECFHRDPDYRIKTIQEIDREIFNLYGKIGLGFKDPPPRPSAEPFGHRFMPAMYGCQCRFDKDSEPCAKERFYTEDDIFALREWSLEDFEKSPPVRETVRQAEYLHKKYGCFSSCPNLGSTINTAISLRGNELFVDYIENPDLLRKLYRNITELMIMAVEYFEKVDELPATSLFLGNCTVAMISPGSYESINMEYDKEFVNYAREKGASFCMHQDSNVTPHIRNYAKLPYVSDLDVGMDTDFELLAKYFPKAGANCIWFPQWIIGHTSSDIEKEVERLMSIGKRFKNFSFTLYEIDELITDEKLFRFYDAVGRNADTFYRGK